MSGQQNPDRAASPSARRILHYEIRERIGRGGMGEVYAARDLRLGRDVALKILPTEFDSDADRVLRFEQEARAATALNHPHIVSVFDTGRAEGRRYIAMELVSGDTITDWATREKPGLRRLLEVLVQAADALGAAHQADVVHRDVKPANILVSRQGYAKVVDFGLAKVGPSASDSIETQSILKPISHAGAIVGTPAYMSPEQASGHRVDSRTDIFSLGAVLYEALTGRRAFSGASDVDVLHAILHNKPQPLRATETVSPLELQWILDKALSKELDERYQTMREFASDLRRLRARLEAGSSTELTPPVAAATSQASSKVAWLAAGALAGVALAALLLTIPSMRSRLAGGAEGPRKETEVTQITYYSGTERWGTISPDGKYFAFVSEKGGAPDIWVRKVSGGDPVQITDDIAGEADLIYSPDGESIYFTKRGEIWRVGSLGGAPQKIVNLGRFPCPSPDGQQLAYAKPTTDAFRISMGEGTVEIAKVDGTSPRKVYEGRGLRELRWSPDGRWIALTDGMLFDTRRVVLVDVASGRSRVVNSDGSGDTYSLAWLPDSKRLVVSRTYDGFPGANTVDLGIVSIDGGPERRLTLNVNTRFMNPSLSANGGRLIATSETFVRELWKVPLGPDPKANGAAATRLLDATSDPFWIHASSDGSTVLFNSRATGSRNLFTVPADMSAPPRQITAFSGNKVTHAALSPDGKQVAYISSQTGLSQVWVANVDGSNPMQLTRDNHQHYWPIWSPDGKWVAFGSTAGGVWKVPAAGGEAIPLNKASGFRRGDWSPKGDRLVLWKPGQLEIVDAKNGQVLREISGLDWTSALPVWNPEGTKFTAIATENLLSHSVWLVDADSGERKRIVQFPGRFHLNFRAAWGKDGKSLLVNRSELVSHIVLIENF